MLAICPSTTLRITESSCSLLGTIIKIESATTFPRSVIEIRNPASAGLVETSWVDSGSIRFSVGIKGLSWSSNTCGFYFEQTAH